MDDDFLLDNDTAKHLFHDHAENLPIIDYHCHLSPKEIYEDIRFDNLADLWLGGQEAGGACSGDHYKWRLMRANGMPEDLVTGRDNGLARFTGFTGAVSLAIGNPMYHWCNLELKKYFGIDEPLLPSNAEDIWNKCNDILRNDPRMSARGLIRLSNVEYVGTTDDPADDLIWHKKLSDDPDTAFTVRPSFRPDNALDITGKGFAGYIETLARSVGKDNLDSIDDVADALLERLEYFVKCGCLASDHGFEKIPFNIISAAECNRIYKKAMASESVSEDEAEAYRTYLLLILARAYHKYGIVMELHYSCVRNVNERMGKMLGPNTGYDMILRGSCGQKLPQLLSELDKTDELPKTVIFSLDPSDNDQIGTLIGCFQGNSIPGRIQHGAAWWFNDSKTGMEKQMRALASHGILGNFIGMLTDSRSFLSYARHDYFRRIMCNMIGTWVKNGEYPDDEEMLKKIVSGISYYNAKRYFGI